MTFDQVKSSGKPMTEFNTGSQRDNREGKGRPDLLPFFVLMRDARHYENGARKYVDRNWELGQHSSTYFASAFRHLAQYMVGDRTEDHLAAARWNIAGMIMNEELVLRGIYPASMMDTPNYQSKETFTMTVINPTLQETARRRGSNAEGGDDSQA